MSSLTARTPTGTATDAGPLRDVLSAVGSVDGSVDSTEHALLEALFHTIPQLRDAPAGGPPPSSNRTKLLAELGKLTDARLRRQCFVLAVELAIVSEGVHESEDQYLEQLRAALRIDDAFARQAIEVLACKYARSMP